MPSNMRHVERREAPKVFRKEMGKVPPHSLEAEQALIGSILLSNSHWDLVAGSVVSGDFYLASHQLIFQAIQSLHETKSPIDLITLSQCLEREGKLDLIGGFGYLAEMTQNTSSAANIQAYAKIIREQSILRNLIEVAQEIAHLGFEPAGRKSDALLDLAESKIFDIANHRQQGDLGPKGVEVLVPEAIEHLEKLAQHGRQDGITGLASGLIELDRKTYGFQGSDLIVLAARPSMGKTTLALNFCEHALLTQPFPVLVFSLEMPRHQLMARLLASLSRVEQTKLRNGRLSDEDWARLSSSHELLMHRKNFFIDDASFMSIPELRAKARRIYREHGGIGLIMIDYLQLMRPGSGIETRALEVADVTRNLKGLAKELAVPVIALSQLNRSLEQRADKRPLLADLRESGSIEQDADLVLFIYRDEIYDEHSPDRGLAELIIGKHRNGPIGSLKISFQSQFARFENCHAPLEPFGDPHA